VAVSHQVKSLEEYLGVQLFRRAGRSIRLTKPGELFLARVERALEEIENGRRELADFKAEDRGTIALGFLRTLDAKYIPELVRRFSVVHPEVRFTFVQNNSATVEAQLERGELDLVFVAVPPGRVDFGWTRIVDQQLVLIVPRGHRLAGRRQVKLRDVAGERFVSFKQGHAIRRMTDDLCQAAGFVPEISFEADDSSSVPGFVAAGFGVGIVPPEACGYADVASLRISEPVARRPIGIDWVEDRYLSASAKLFREFVIGTRSPSAR